MVPCYFHKKHGEKADRCDKGLCSYHLASLSINLEDTHDQEVSSSPKDISTLSPIVVYSDLYEANKMYFSDKGSRSFKIGTCKQET